MGGLEPIQPIIKPPPKPLPVPPPPLQQDGAKHYLRNRTNLSQKWIVFQSFRRRRVLRLVDKFLLRVGVDLQFGAGDVRRFGHVATATDAAVVVDVDDLADVLRVLKQHRRKFITETLHSGKPRIHSSTAAVVSPVVNRI